jgi:hypothetical protein
VVAEVIVVVSPLGDELLVGSGRNGSEEIRCERSPILRARPVAWHVVDRLRLETSAEANAEYRLLVEIHALIEPAALLGVEEV